MTDAHFHRNGFAAFMRKDDGSEVRFLGFHPWQEDCVYSNLEKLRLSLQDDESACVGEIGLDRLRSKTITESSRELFARQLEMAATFCRPVVLHGAKCWGEVVAACRQHRGRIPAFLFHGFSRSAGLLPDIFAINGYISIGPAILNDHAVNYHALARELPLERTLIETDMDYAADTDVALATLQSIHSEFASLRGLGMDELSGILADNIRRFLSRT